MKLLFYNWIQDFDPEKRGGGVRIYQENLINELAKRNGYEVFALSAGVSYSFLKKRPFVRKIRFKPRGQAFSKVSFYEIVNSDVLSPAHFSFGENERVFEKNETFQVFDDFIAAKGPFDVIHFNNLEGLPFSVLELKQKYPETKFVFSIHNYYALCPQVNLWRSETENCFDYEDGKLCVNCVGRPNVPEILFANRLAYTIKNFGIRGGSRKFRKIFKVVGAIRHDNSHPALKKAILLADKMIGLANRLDSWHQKKKRARKNPHNSLVLRSGGSRGPATFKYRREAALDLINRYCDKCLAVSAQVKDLVVSFGLREDFTAVSYIGTKHYKRFMESARRLSRLSHDELSVCYMGYMRRDKGFYFLIETLEKMPLYLSRKIRLKVIAPISDHNALQRLKEVAPHYAHLEVINGYTHDELDSLLADCDLGIVPVLWQDNLPQVAIEIVSRGVPVLTSHLGGAKELGGNNRDFIFLAGNHRSLINKLSQLLAGEILLSSFWTKANFLVSMEQHVDELLAHYKEEVKPAQSLTGPMDGLPRQQEDFELSAPRS